MLKMNRVVLLIMVLSIFLVGTAQAAAAPAIGVVDYLYLINNHPDTPKANEALKAEQEQDKQLFNEKSAGMNDEDKQALDRQLGQQFAQKRLELLKPIAEQVNAAIKEIADAKGLTTVIGKNFVIYGGVDITADVMNKITKK